MNEPTDRDDLEGTALGTLQPGMETTIRVPVFTTAHREGEVDETLLLTRLQDLALVSPDVREVFLDAAGDGWNVVDVDTEDTVAWFVLPIGAGY